MFRRVTAAATALVLGIGSFVAISPASATSSPSVPAIDAARTTSVGDVLLAWQPVSGAQSYVAEIATDTNEASRLDKVTTSALAWAPAVVLNTGPTPETLYWRVGASSAKTGTDAQFSEWQAVTREGAGVPALVLPASAGTVSYPDATTFRWDPVAGASGYTLQYTSNDFADLSTTTTVDVGTTAHTPTAPLTRNGADNQPIQWRWRVRANFAPGSQTTSNSLRPGTWSDARTFTISWPSSQPTTWVTSSPLNGPSTPLADETVTDVRLAWEPVRGASKYKIVIGRTGGSNGTGPASPDGTSTGVIGNIYHQAVTPGTTYVPQIAMPDTGYLWQVVPLDADGREGTASLIRRYTKVWGAQEPARGTASDPTFPVPTFGGLQRHTAASVSISDLELTWQAVPRATFYAVTVWDEATGKTLSCRTANTSATVIGLINRTSQGIDRPVTSANQLTDESLCLWSSTPSERIKPGGSYRWSVKAFDLSATDKRAFATVTGQELLESMESPVRYFDVTGPRAATDVKVALDGSRWTPVSTEATPQMAWEPSMANDGSANPMYEVEVALNPTFTNRVGWFYTPSTRMRINGIFLPQSSDQTYYYRVTAGEMSGTSWTQSNATLWSNTVSHDPHQDEITSAARWNQQTTPVAQTGMRAERVAGDVVLAWDAKRPSATDTSGSRGYAVEISNDQNVRIALLQVEKPLVIVQPEPKVTSITGQPTSSIEETRLPAGKYHYKVVALDAAGRASAWPDATVEFTVEPAELRAEHATVEPLGDAVSLRWEAPTALRYTVDVTGPDGRTTTYGANHRQTAITIDGLTLSGRYTWHASAYGAAARAIGTSPSGSFTVSSGPVRLTTTDETTLEPRQLALTWASHERFAGYRVRVATSAAALSTTTPIVTRSTTFVPTGSLAYGTKYFWSVEPFTVNAKGTVSRLHPVSSVGSFSVLTAPSTPSNLKLVVAGRSITASWSALTGAALGSGRTPTYWLQYRVARPDGLENPWITSAGVEGGLSQHLSGLALDATYEFRVAASNTLGQSSWSASQRAKTTTLPGVVSSVSTTARLGGFTVSWRAPASTGGSKITGYTVRYRSGSGTWKSVSTTSTSMTVSGLARSARYEVQVEAVNAVGSGPVASTSVTTLAVPGAPTSVQARRADRSATVYWKAPGTTGGSAITGYTIEVRAYTNKRWTAWSSKARVSPTAVKHTVTGLANGTKHEFRVLAASRLGSGTASASATATPAGKPLAPGSVKAKATKKKTLKVSWKPGAHNGSKLTKQVVQYSTNGKKWKTLAKVSAKTTSFTWKKAKSGRTYHFRVYATNALGSGVKSSPVRVVAK